jgi:hypothetical protein
MGLAGRQFVEANFDRQVLAGRYEALLTAVVNDAGRATVDRHA